MTNRCFIERTSLRSSRHCWRTGFQEGDSDRDRLQQIRFSVDWSPVFPSERASAYFLSGNVQSGRSGCPWNRVPWRPTRFSSRVSAARDDGASEEHRYSILGEFTVIYRTQDIALFFAVIRDRRPLSVTHSSTFGTDSAWLWAVDRYISCTYIIRRSFVRSVSFSPFVISRFLGHISR